MKKNIICIPFSSVPLCVSFRYQKKWWKRKVGTSNYAVCINDSRYHQVIYGDAPVAISKKDLNKKKNSKIIFELFL